MKESSSDYHDFVLASRVREKNAHLEKNEPGHEGEDEIAQYSSMPHVSVPNAEANPRRRGRH